MLVIANGAFKSGSTWIYNVAVELVRPEDLPARYLREDWSNPSIRTGMLRRLADGNDVTLDPGRSDYVTKNHLGYEYQDILDHPHIRVLNVTRDIRDVLVSAYFHHKRVESYRGSIDEYYADMGRDVVADVLRHHEAWTIRHPRLFVTSYEEMTTSFPSVVLEMADFLNMRITQRDVDRIREATDFSRLRSAEELANPGPYLRFYRRGEVGDWRNHLSDGVLADLHRLVREHPSGTRSLWLSGSEF